MSFRALQMLMSLSHPQISEPYFTPREAVGSNDSKSRRFSLLRRFASNPMARDHSSVVPTVLGD